MLGHVHPFVRVLGPVAATVAEGTSRLRFRLCARELHEHSAIHGGARVVEYHLTDRGETLSVSIE